MMKMKKKKFKKERYSIIISCETDARKKPFCFSIKRRTVIAGVTVFLLIVTVSAGISIFSSSEASVYSNKTKALKGEAGQQLEAIDSYKDEVDAKREELVDLRMYERMFGNE